MSEGFRLYNFSFSDVSPGLEDVLEFLQSSESEEDHPVRLTAMDTLHRLQSHKDIFGGYIVKEIESSDLKSGLITIENTELQVGSQICGYLKGASHAALFICTAGNIFTEITREYNARGEYLEAFVADAIGSLTVENAMDKIQQDLENSLNAENLKITNRYSPGYCNWSLSGQKELFALVGNNTVGIELTDSCLMNPIKSVSGIIGIGESVKKRAYGCEICRNAECIYRKILNKK